MFVLLGLGVLVVGLSGGPRGAIQQLQTQSRGGRKAAIVLFSIALIVLGVGIPYAVIKAVDDRDDIPTANVSNLTPRRSTAASCSPSAARSATRWRRPTRSPRSGPDLDQLRPPESLVLDALKNGRARGNGQMAAGLYEGEDAKDVADVRRQGRRADRPGRGRRPAAERRGARSAARVSATSANLRRTSRRLRQTACLQAFFQLLRCRPRIR